FGSDFYVTGLLGNIDHMVRDVPLGGSQGDARIDPAGIVHGAWFGLVEDRRTRIGEVTGSWFFNTGELSHEIKGGLSKREQDDENLLTAPGSIDVAGEILERFPSTEVVEVW